MLFIKTVCQVAVISGGKRSCRTGYRADGQRLNCKKVRRQSTKGGNCSSPVAGTKSGGGSQSSKRQYTFFSASSIDAISANFFFALFPLTSERYAFGQKKWHTPRESNHCFYGFGERQPVEKQASTPQLQAPSICGPTADAPQHQSVDAS